PRRTPVGAETIMNGGGHLDRWHRPYGWTVDMIPEWVMLVVSGVVVVGGLILMGMLGLDGRLTGAAALLLLAAFGPFVPAIWLLRRALRVGLYVRSSGLRIQELAGSRTLPWP